MENYELGRFLEAQKDTYAIAKRELEQGRKKSHWMWYIFPQVAGIGSSPISAYFAIQSIVEAKAYYENVTLRARLLELCEILLALDETDPQRIFDTPDDLKLRSCMTLFSYVAPEEGLFLRVLEKFYGGKRDETTLRILRAWAD